MTVAQEPVRSTVEIETHPVRRWRSGRWLFGVCGGFATHFGVPVWVVRCLWAASVVPTAGLSALAYVILAGLVGVEDDSARRGGR